jgi:hypothetical protein
LLNVQDYKKFKRSTFSVFILAGLDLIPGLCASGSPIWVIDKSNHFNITQGQEWQKEPLLTLSFCLTFALKPLQDGLMLTLLKANPEQIHSEAESWQRQFWKPRRTGFP